MGGKLVPKNNLQLTSTSQWESAKEGCSEQSHSGFSASSFLSAFAFCLSLLRRLFPCPDCPLALSLPLEDCREVAPPVQEEAGEMSLELLLLISPGG